MPSVTKRNQRNPRLNSFQSPSERDAAALALTPAERRRSVARFFAATPGTAGLGRAVADFLEWEIRSGRITDGGGGSPWWRTTNGHLVLDLDDASARLASGDSGAPIGRHANEDPVGAWVRFATCEPAADDPTATDPAGPTPAQAALWAAHQASLTAALARAEALLDAEPPDERWFARTAVAMVGHAAERAQATDTDLLDRMTRRHYPDRYPATAEDRTALEAVVAAAAQPDQSGSR